MFTSWLIALLDPAALSF